MRIGRCEDVKVASFSQSGGILDLTFTARETRDLSDVVIQQINGHVGDVVPIVGDECDPLDDGYYQLLSATVESDKERYRTNGLTAVSVSLRRIASPALELVGPRSERPSDLTLASSDLLASWAAPDYLWSNAAAGEIPVVGGVVKQYSAGTDDSDYDPDYVMRSGVPAASFYEGAATIEDLRDGSWYPVVGRMVRESGTPRLSNGWFRVWMDGVDLNLQHALSDGSDWGNTFTFSVKNSDGSVTWEAAPGYAVLRESTQTVSVKLVLVSSDGSAEQAQSLTLRLDRAQEYVEIYYEGSQVSARLLTPEPGTLFGSPFPRCAYMTTKDSNDHRWVTLSPRTSVSDTNTTLNTDDRGVGLGITSSPSSPPSKAIAKFFFLAEDQVQTVVEL